METSHSRVVAVIGMHRSGTSLVARALRALGVGLGGNLSTAPSSDNAKGHWEDRDVLALNEQLMDVLALRWDLLGARDEALMGAPALAPLVARAQELVEQKAAAETLAWAFKDPRTARLWPFWRRVLLGRDGLSPAFVWVIRRPQAVAHSLLLRNGCPPTKSHLLWLGHNVAPCADIAAHPHAVVDYDRLLSHPRRELRRLSEQLALPPAQESAVAAFSDEFLDADLSHHRPADDRPAGVGLEQVATKAYSALLRVAGDAGALQDAAFEADWRSLREEAEVFWSIAPVVDAASLATRSQRQMELQLRHDVAGLSERIGREAAVLQGQFSDALRAQWAETGSRLEVLQGQVADTLREQSAESGRHLLQVVERNAAVLQGQFSDALRAQWAETGSRLEVLQGQVADTLREQSAESGRHLLQVVERNAAVLQGQFSDALHEQWAETGSRLEVLQGQVADTLREQSAESGRHLLQVVERNAAVLQGQFSDALRAQWAETGSRLESMNQHLDSQEVELRQTQAHLVRLGELLNAERYTVFKPLLRRAYRFGVALAKRSPMPLQQGLRWLKRRLLPKPVVLRVDFEPAASQGDGQAVVAFDQPAPDRHDILICPVIDWRFRLQRPQHMAEQLAAFGHRVFYLSTTFVQADEPGFKLLERPAPNLFLVQLRLPGKHPRIYEDLLRGKPLRRMLAAVEELIAAAGLGRLVTLVHLPFWRPLAQALPGSLLVYDCMDHHAGFSTNSDRMIEEEDALVKRADLVVTTSAGLSETIGRQAPNLVVRNAAATEHFGRQPETLAYVSDRPVVGYLGAVAEWFDTDLIVNAAKRRPGWDFVLVGATAGCDVAEMRRLANVKLVGEVPYDEAAAWVHSFDAALIPFKLNDLTRCTNPVKAYEYLAAGKPVVATALPEVKLMDGMAHVAENEEHFVQLLDVAVAEAGDAGLAARRAAWASAHNWQARAAQLQGAIDAAFGSVSIILLTYNNLTFTQACLDSLKTHTQYPNWELILVDNASTDGSRPFLEDYAAADPHVKLVCNDENLGFAAGNNRGLEIADGEHLVILNNDTYVTPGWMLDLVRHLRQDAALGLVGPVTNNIGNEAKIDIQYANMEEMQRAARIYTASHARQALEAQVVAFFCVALPRAVYEAVGGLDERFGLGFFEDDDYCQRVRQAGFKVAIAEDVFVHHHLSATFDQLDAQRRQALFERNKAIYEEKWGPWTPHKYRD